MIFYIVASFLHLLDTYGLILSDLSQPHLPFDAGAPKATRMMPPAKLAAYFAVASSIVLARSEASTDITDTNDTNKLSISVPSDPVQHDTKQPLRTSDTAVTKANEERMFNVPGLKRASTMSHLPDVHGLPHEPLAPHLHDTYDPAGAPHPPVLPYTDEAKAHEDLQHAASTSNPLRKISPADTQLTEGENSEAETLKESMTLIQPVAPHTLKRKLPDGTETQLQWNESNIRKIRKKHNDELLSLMNEWWQSNQGIEPFKRMILENQLPKSIYEKYEKFHAAKDEEMHEHFVKWQNDGILPTEIDDKINAVLPKARREALVVRYKKEYEVFYEKKQPFEAYRTKLLDEETKPEEAESLKSEKMIRLRRGLLKPEGILRRHTMYTQQWYEKHPNEFLQKSMQKRTIPEDVHSAFGLAQLEGPELFEHPNYKYYLKYLKSWFETHPTEHWQKRVPKGMPPEDVRFILGLAELQSPEIFEHPNYSAYFEYLQSWFKTHPTERWQKRVLEGMPPQDVRFVLGLGQLKGSELSQHPNFPEYIKFFEVWHEAYTRKKMKEWMQLKTPPDEVFAKLAVRDHDDVEHILDKSDVYIKEYENEWKKKHPTLGTPAVST